MDLAVGGGWRQKFQDGGAGRHCWTGCSSGPVQQGDFSMKFAQKVQLKCGKWGNDVSLSFVDKNKLEKYGKSKSYYMETIVAKMSRLRKFPDRGGRFLTDSVWIMQMTANWQLDNSDNIAGMTGWWPWKTALEKTNRNVGSSKRWVRRFASRDAELSEFYFFLTFF